MSGGTALLALAALLAFWPRRGTTPGYPLAAAVALGTLYAVPVDRARARLAVLRRRAVLHPPRRLPVARARALATRWPWPRPAWWPRRSSGRSSRRAWTAAGRGSTTRTSPRSSSPRRPRPFSWTHSYGPLTWSRDGREMLRIKATAPAYWKATNLDDFDGVRWREGAAVARRRHPSRARTASGCRRSRSSTAGCARRSSSAPATSRTSSRAPRAWRCRRATAPSSPRPSRCARATATRRCVYVPAPDRHPAQARSGTNYPGYTQDFLSMRVPLRGRPPASWTR